MGMRIGGSSNAWANQQSSSAVNWQQRHQNFKSLKTALQGNDLAGAQQAFAALSASNPNALANPNSALSQMGKALQAGNMPAAQQVAQNWQSNQQSSTASSPTTDPNAALASFLQTLTASTSQGNSAGSGQNASSDSSAGDSSAPAAPAPVAVAATPQQVAQALVAFEKNLFDSLQLQNGGSSPSSTTTGSATTAAAATATAPTDPTSVSSDLSAPAQAVPNPATAQGHHHHHHHSGQGGGQLNSELSALIGQTSTDANGATTAAATGSGSATAGLDQSFKNLLTTLGVTGNNASLNSFLQNLSTNSASAQTTTA